MNIEALLKILKYALLPSGAVTGFSFMSTDSDSDVFMYLIGAAVDNEKPASEPVLAKLDNKVLNTSLNPKLINAPAPIQKIQSLAPLRPGSVQDPKDCNPWIVFRTIEVKVYHSHGDGWADNHAYIRIQYYFAMFKFNEKCELMMIIKPIGNTIELGWESVSKSYSTQYLCGGRFFKDKNKD